jgi:hypothetical protein
MRLPSIAGVLAGVLIAAMTEDGTHTHDPGAHRRHERAD